jgi:hypothetical protein
MFELIKITDHYVLDRKSMNLYSVDTNNGRDVKGFRLCCELRRNNDNYDVARHASVAIGIVEKAKELCYKLEIA